MPRGTLAAAAAAVLALAALVASARASCPANAVQDGPDGLCVCPAGFHWEDESCLPCPAGTYVPAGGPSPTGHRGACLECPAVSDRGGPTHASSPPASATCFCEAGYRMPAGADPDSLPREFTETPCVPCDADTFGASFSRNDSCAACACGRTTDGEDGRTFCGCPEGATRDAASDQCVCNDGRKEFSCAESSCVCRDGFFTHAGGECHLCPEGRILLDDDEGARVCECPFGQYEEEGDDAGGRPKTGCYCPEGTALQRDGEGGACCPDATRYVRGAGCTCPLGQSLRSDNLCHPDAAEGDLVPVLECVDEGEDGTLVARFGYENRAGGAASVPVGERNNFGEGAAADRGQPTAFLDVPFVSDAVRVPLAGGPATWTLLGQSVTAGAASPRCDRPLVCTDADFEGVEAGQTVAGQYLFSGLALRLLSPPGARLAALDASAPPPGREDLGAPSEACGGPGRGGGDAAASSNCEGLGRVLVPARAVEPGASPYAWPLAGPASLALEFDAPVTLASLSLLSAAPGDTVAVTYASAAGDTASASFEVPGDGTAEANAVVAVRVGLSGVTRAVVSFAGARGPGAVVSASYCEDTPLASCDDVLRRRPRGAPDGVYRVLDPALPGGVRRVYCRFDDGGNRDCGEELFDEESLRRGGVFRLANHKSGNRGPPQYGLRLDRLGPEHRYWTFDFDHPSSDMRMSWEPELGRLRVFGHAYGGPDVGTRYADGYPHRYRVDFTYEGVQVESGGASLYTAERDENTGSITDLSVSPPAEYALEQFMYFRMKRYHRGEDRRYSGYGWLNHSGKPHVYASDFLFTVAGCDNDDRRGWTLVMNQQTDAALGGGYFDEAAVRAGDVAGDDPTAPLYSSLATVLPRLEGEHGHEYLMEWPGLEGGGPQVWQQRGSFMRGEQPGDWAPIEVTHTGRYFAGLEPGSGGRAAADGSVDSAQWFYAVASFGEARPGCPLPGPFGCVGAARLYARPARAAPASSVEHCGSDCDSHPNRQCVATVPWVGPACVPVQAPRTCENVATGGGGGGGDETPYCFAEHLVAYYPFDERAGPTCHDRSGVAPALDLELAGDASWDAERGVRFGGAGAAASSASAAKIVRAAREANALTVELWVRGSLLSADDDSSIFSLDDGEDCVYQQGVRLSQGAGGSLRYRLHTSRAPSSCEGGVETAYAAGAAGSGNAERCLHLVMTWDGSDKRLYVDGAEASPEAGAEGAAAGDLSALSPAFFLRLGSGKGLARGWRGALLSLAVWSAPAAPADVAALHARGCGGGAPGQACALERLAAETSAPHWVDPDGAAPGTEPPVLAACSRGDTEGVAGWTRVLFQDYAAEGPFPPAFDLASRGYGARSGAGGLFSALHELEHFRGPDGFLFRLEYPGQPGLPELVWAQTGNPAAEGEAAGFRFSLGGCDTPAGFRGLARGAGDGHSFIDGTTHAQGAWAYAVGTTRSMLPGMPVVPGGQPASAVALWVRRAEFGTADGAPCSCSDGYRCAADGEAAACVPADAPATCAEALAAASGGADAGEFWLAPGGGAFVRTRCEAGAAGRVWTRALLHDTACPSAPGFFEAPASRLASQSDNALRPCECRFSLLNRLADLAGPGGLDLRLRWRLADGDGGEVVHNTWRQTSLPTAGEAQPEGYLPLDVRYVEGGFAGLALARGNDPLALLRGGADNATGGAAYAAGSVRPAADASVCPFHAAPGVCARSVELLVSPVAAGQPACQPCPAGQERRPTEFSACRCAAGSPDRHCAEVLGRDPDAADGAHWVDPDQLDGEPAANLPSLQVECDMSPDAKNHSGLTLVAFQKCSRGGFFPPEFDLATQRYDPEHGLAFSMLNQLEHLRGPGGFLFRLEWPGSGKAPQTWIQATNPVTGAAGDPPEGYLAVSVPHVVGGWQGLGRSARSTALLDGSSNADGGWYFAVGTTARFGCGAPGPGGCVPESQLWARPAPGCDCASDEACRYLDSGGHVCLPAGLPGSCAAAAASPGGLAEGGEPASAEEDSAPAFYRWVDADADGPADPWRATCVPRAGSPAVSGPTAEVGGLEPGANERQFCFDAEEALVDVVVHAAVTSVDGGAAGGADRDGPPVCTTAADPAELTGNACHTVTFDGLAAPGAGGEYAVLSDQFAALGLRFSSLQLPEGGAVVAVAADAATGDRHLAAPNEHCDVCRGDDAVPCPGSGSDPEGSNCAPRGVVAVLAKNADRAAPQSQTQGAVMVLEFDYDVTLESFGLLANHKKGSKLALYDAKGAMIGGDTLELPAGGRNSYQLVSVGVSGVRRAEVFLRSSAALDDIVFCGGACRPAPAAVEVPGGGAAAPLAALVQVPAGTRACVGLPLRAGEAPWTSAELTVWLSFGRAAASIDAVAERDVLTLQAALLPADEDRPPAVMLATNTTASVPPNRWTWVTLNWASLECVSGVEARVEAPEGWQVSEVAVQDQGGDLCPGGSVSTSLWVRPPSGECGVEELAVTVSYRRRGEASRETAEAGPVAVPVRCVSVLGHGLVLGRCHRRRHGGGHVRGSVYVAMRLWVEADSGLELRDLVTESLHPAAELIAGAAYQGRFGSGFRVYLILRVRCDALDDFLGRHRLRMRGSCLVRGRRRYFWWHFDVSREIDGDGDDHDGETDDKRAAALLAAAEAASGSGSASPLGLYTVSPTALRATARRQVFSLTLAAEAGLGGLSFVLSTTLGTLSFPGDAAAPELDGGRAALAAGEDGALVFELELPEGAAGTAELLLEVTLEAGGLPVTETHRLTVAAEAADVRLLSDDLGSASARAGPVSHHTFEADASAGVTDLEVVDVQGPPGVAFNATVRPHENNRSLVALSVDSSASVASGEAVYAEVTLSYKVHGVTRVRTETLSSSGPAVQAPAGGASSGGVFTPAVVAAVAAGAALVVLLAAAAVVAVRRRSARAGKAAAGEMAAKSGAEPGAEMTRSSSFTFNDVASQMAAGRRLSISEVKSVYDDVYDDADAEAADAADASDEANAELALQRTQDVVSRANAAVQRARLAGARDQSE